MTSTRKEPPRTLHQLEMKLTDTEAVLRAAQLQTQQAMANEETADAAFRKARSELWIRQAQEYGLKLESGKLKLLLPAESGVK